MAKSRFVRAVPCLLVVATATAQRFDEMRMGSLPAPRGATTCVVVVDLDGDGDRDIVCGGSNRFYRNRGDGVFADDTRLALPPDLGPVMAIAWGDFDGDGDRDLLCGVGGFTSCQDRLLFNDGAGHFADVTATKLPVDADATMDVASGDIDGDGDLDLVFGNNGIWSDPCRVYANNGIGNFTDVTATWLGSVPLVASSVALADVDLDGDLDLLLNEPVRLFRNHAGVFTDVSATHVPPGTGAARLVLADVDGDGDQDVFCPGWSVARLLRNQSGVFTDVSATHVPVGGTSGPPWAVIAVDLDGDGDVDIAEAGRTLRNGGNGVFTSAAAIWSGAQPLHAIADADLDADGDVDLVLSTRELDTGCHHLLLGDGAGAFADVTPDRIEGGWLHGGHLVAGDFDGDGDGDLASFGQEAHQWRNDGSGWFTEVSAADLVQLVSPATAAATFDADGDGDLDLVVAGTGMNELWHNDGHGAFTRARSGTLPCPFVAPYVIVSGDFDGDGDVDLVYGASLWGAILLDNIGGTRFVATRQIPLSFGLGNTHALAVGDIDADGDLDVVAASDGMQSRLYRNRGNGWFVDATADLPPDADATHGLALVDVDGDGDLDLYCANSWSMSTMNAQDRLYRNDGAGRFTDITATTLPIDNHVAAGVAVGDVDGDGDADVLLIGPCSAGADRRLLRNDGTGRFVDATDNEWPGELSCGGVVLDDLDRDGDLDLVSGRATPRIVAMNLTRQLHAPWPARVGRTFALEVWQRGAGGPGVAVPFLSTARLAPLATPFGRLGIVPMLPLPAISVPHPDGTGVLQFTLPASPALVGLTFHAQALLGAAGTVQLTNVTTNVVLP